MQEKDYKKIRTLKYFYYKVRGNDFNCYNIFASHLAKVTWARRIIYNC